MGKKAWCWVTGCLLDESTSARVQATILYKGELIEQCWREKASAGYVGVLFHLSIFINQPNGYYSGYKHMATHHYIAYMTDPLVIKIQTCDCIGCQVKKFFHIVFCA